MQGAALASGVADWLQETLETMAIINAIVRVIHPGLFHYGLLRWNRLREENNHKVPAKSWLSIYTGMAVIANQETPVHCDSHCWVGWYNLLASVGPYMEAKMELPTVGIKATYPPGTLSALSRHVLSHRVSPTEGE
ncbi:hypothetical protein JAAARDRAFT_143428 [Jaapia argillacea MUCL 33604]|uniref:2OGFeDO JBP1/TET oxygenase domain-containing protein n=1 Tax=Jaapia argillacea MUCL 33604 TaxID=933084 RepID=A0A067P3H8_9AGAM|nr:hypothetical protein JAAARDRAFT_143428 [Jaapia argillacea MUCL 33604]